MATHAHTTTRVPTTPPSYPPTSLAAFRRAHVARIEDAAERAQISDGGCSRTPAPAAMPHTLFAAGVFLAAFGLAIDPTPAEQAFGVTPAAYADTLASDVGDATIEAGRKALFGRWKPIVRPELAAELERTVAMSRAWDDMADAAGTFDGSFEAAKARFDALAGGR